MMEQPIIAGTLLQQIVKWLMCFMSVLETLGGMIQVVLAVEDFQRHGKGVTT